MQSASNVLIDIERRPIPGYPGYWADATGHIWRLDGGRPRGRLSEIPERDGYWAVQVYIAGQRRRRRVSRLVALAFHGEPAPGLEARHLDGSRDNNVPSNLAWGTPQDNANDRERHGRTARGNRSGARRHPDTLARGERNAAARLTATQVGDIRQRHQSGVCSQHQLAAEYGVSVSTIGRVVQGRTWRGVWPQLSSERYYPDQRVHWTRRYPERIARGARNGNYTHPERRRRGEQSPQAKLTWEQVRQARMLYAAGGTTMQRLADHYGVHLVTMSNALRGKTWTEQPSPPPPAAPEEA